MPSVPLPVQPPLTRSEIEAIIFQNRGIADVSALREQITMSVPLPVAWQRQNRQAHLRPFGAFFERILDPDSSSPGVRTLVGRLAMAALSGQCGWSAPELRQVPLALDVRFNDPGDLLIPVFGAIFQEAALLRQWMRTLDDHVASSSRDTLEAMDQAARLGAAPVRKDVVLVGCGPLASIIASILGSFFRVTVVTRMRAIGKPWRNRPIYINSSCEVEDFNGPGLPLQGGATTRVIGSQQWNSLDVDVLLDLDTKNVACDTGRVARYPAGPRLGDLVATDLLLHADDFLVNQEVDVSQMQRNGDGSVRLVLLDTEDGTTRLLDATAVFVVTGPGGEQTRIPDAPSRRLYREVGERLDADLRQARLRIAPLRKALRQLERLPSFPVVEAQRRELRERIAEVARGVTLPRLLTLTAVEKLYEFWDDDLDGDPAAYPLAELIAGREPVAYIGGGDTARTLKELVDERGPDCAYPAGWTRRRGLRASTIYNETASTPAEYAERNRRRYGDVFTPATRSIPFKARRYRLAQQDSRVEVTYFDASGKRRRNRYGYAFDATGLDRRPIEALLPPAFAMRTVRDLEGIGVARGDTSGALFIAGSATGTQEFDLPGDLKAIITALGIAENPVSLWANGVLGERLALTYAATRPPTKPAPPR
jgi:hypothetical protein